MDVDTLLEAFQDFEKKIKRDTCPALEKFLCHVAKTGQAVIPWSQFKTYFMFKLEKVMDDFHASAPEQRGQQNPNVEHVPFEEMKKRILKIVDGYNGTPFTIQRLCELLTEPKRNYTGTDKFLRGIEKNVMVVSCVYPSSEKNVASGGNRMNGVMFPGHSSLYSDSRNVNGPSTPKALSSPKLSLSTNGYPDCPASKEPEPSVEGAEEQRGSDSSLSDGENIPNTGMKKKHPQEDEEDADEHETKRLKFDDKAEDETGGLERESAPRPGSESVPETSESSRDSCEQELKREASCDGPPFPEDPERSSTDAETSEREEDEEEDEEEEASPEREEAQSPKNNQPEQPAPSEKNTSFEQDNGESSSSSSSSSSSDGESLPSDKQVLSSSSNSPDLSAEGDADGTNSTEAAVFEPGD